MADLLNSLHWEALTGVVRQFDVPAGQFYFVQNTPSRDIAGDVFSWDTLKQAINVDDVFTQRDGTAEAVRGNDYGKKTAVLVHSFKSRTLDAGTLMQLRAPGTNDRDSRALLMEEQQTLQWRYGTYLDEWMITRAMTGTLTVKLGNVRQNVSYNITYGVPTSHTPTSAATWSAVGTNILTDLLNFKRIIARDSGLQAKTALCNQGVMNYMLRNTDLINWMGQTPLSLQIQANGHITRLAGLDFVVYDAHFADTTVTDQFNTPFIANDRLLVIPDWSARWCELVRGTVPIPNSDLTGFVETNPGSGPVMWSRVTDSPTGVTLYYRYARLPVIRRPEAFVYATVA